MDGGAPYDVLRDEVVDMGVGLIRVEQRRHRLEDLFRTESDEEEVAANV
jgi:ABC-2 type transport system ATP-binding protein